MIEITIENVFDNKEELLPIFMEHYEELETEKERLKPFDFFWEGYRASDNAGSLLFIAVRKDGKMIGYCINFLMPSFFYKSISTCLTHIFYIKREERKGGAGIKMLKFLEKELRALGVKEWLSGYRVNLDISKIYERLGFEKTEVLYRKILGD